MKWKVCFQKVPHAATHGDRCGNAVHGSFTCVYLHHLSEWCCRNPASHCPCTDRISIKDLLLSNALVVSMPPIGLLRCNAVLEDLQTFLKQQPLLRWPYGGVHHLHAYFAFEHNGFQHGEPDGTALWKGTVSFSYYFFFYYYYFYYYYYCYYLEDRFDSFCTMKLRFGGTSRTCKWLRSPPFISPLGHLEGEQPYLRDLLTKGY